MFIFYYLLEKIGWYRGGKMVKYNAVSNDFCASENGVSYK